MKKSFAILLALAMVLILSVPAFATPANPGTITIKGSANGETYTAYKIFDVTFTDGDPEAPHAYTIEGDSPWFTTVQTYANAADNLDNDGLTLTPTASANDNTYVVTINPDKFDPAKFAEALETYRASQTNPPITYQGSTTGNGGDATISNLPVGYYLVSSSVVGADGRICSLGTTDNNAVIYDKNEQPPFEKVVDDYSVEVGQTVTFTITGHMPSVVGYHYYQYRVTDSMTAGLDFNEGSVVVTIGTTVFKSNPNTANGEHNLSELNATYGEAPSTTTVTAYSEQANGFTLDMDMAYLHGEGRVGEDWNYADPITITYTATVLETATADTDTVNYETNTATLRYSTDPAHSEQGDNNNSTEDITKEVSVYTVDIEIVKYTGDIEGTNTKLADADFVLFKYMKEESSVWVDCAEGDAGATKFYYTYDETNDVVGWDQSFANAYHRVTDANGNAQFLGLDEGTYYLEEVVAPAGYNKLTTYPVVTIADVDINEGTTYTVANTPVDQIANVENNTGEELPETGGIGTKIFYVVGGLMMASAVVLLVTRKKMSVEE